MWFENCSKTLDNALHSLQLKETSEFDDLSLHHKNVEGVGGIFRYCGDSQHTLHLEEWRAVWHMIENIYIKAVDSGNVWKDEKNGQRKRRTLFELLDLLERNGLSRHKSAYKDEHKTWWFLQLSGNLQYLLLASSRLPSVTLETTAGVEYKNVPDESLLMEWKTSIEHYFKSVASVLLLLQICLNPHKDITLEQVDRSSSFLNQLIQIQQKQLAAATAFNEQLKHFRECVSTLGKSFSFSSSTDNNTNYMCSIIPKQLATYKCMWQQKQLFDSLCAISNEELLLLRTLENSHLNSCQGTRPSADRKSVV